MKPLTKPLKWFNNFWNSYNIRLVCLPPYSPQLNPVEQLWKGIRTRFFGNAYFETLDAVEAHLVKALRWVEANTAWVKSFAYFPYIQHAI
ncbi:MAG: transposase [Vampirovibrio sp.]|nr:transposase [Vampirovibrio sp.]